MRDEFVRALIGLYQRRSDLVFMTGDVGYLAIEELATTFGDRFINAGVAEQNMVSLAAGMAREGYLPWLYSIAPFVVLRPYEQIRTDVCLHQLPVKLVGNGGGYGYGIMGATHHGLEDIGAMRVLPNMRVYVPLTATDVEQAVVLMAADPLANYLRLNTVAPISGELPPFAPWRRLKGGRSTVVIGTGPVLGNIYELGDPDLLEELEVWCVGTFPIDDIPAELVASIQIKRVVTIEEHYSAGGLAEALCHSLMRRGVGVSSFTSLHAAGYPSGRYGSQRWHQEESGLAGSGLRLRLQKVVRG